MNTYISEKHELVTETNDKVLDVSVTRCVDDEYL